MTQEEFIKEQGETIQMLYKQVGGNSNEDLEIFAAENPRLIFELANRLRKGISVVFYIDGNTGASEKKVNENENLLKINFLSHHIYARQGIAFLAYLSKAPIALVIAKRYQDINNSIHINSVETKKLLKKHTRKDYIKITTQLLYRQLESFLKSNLEQWEGWFYIHKFFHIELPTKNLIQKKHFKNKLATLVLDQFIQLIKYDDDRVFLVMKREYQIMKITNSLYQILIFSKIPKKIIVNNKTSINNQIVEWSFIEELIEMKLVKPL